MRLFRSLTLIETGILGAALLVYGCPSVQADDPVQPPKIIKAPPSPPSIDAHKALQFVVTRDACSLPLDLKAEGATVEELAPRVQKRLATSSVPAIKQLRVEVRNVKPIRLTFDTKGSTVGGVLNSIAFLSSAKLWIFPDHLLIAPEEGLTAEEENLSKINFQTNDRRLPIEVTNAFTSFIRDEINGLPGSATAKPSFKSEFGTTEKSLGGASFDQLSPDAQAMLQALVQSANPTAFMNSPYHYEPMKLTPDSFVNITNTFQDGSISVQTPPTNTPSVFRLGWSFSGGGTFASAGGGTPTPPPPPSRSTPPFVDPSAGKSE